MTDSILSMDRIHTTPMGRARISKNLGLNETDAMRACMDAVRNGAAVRRGKNYYITHNDMTVTIHARAMTVITAHKHKKTPGKPGVLIIK